MNDEVKKKISLIDELIVSNNDKKKRHNFSWR